MSVGITIPKSSGGILNSKAFKMGTGIARMVAGDPTGALSLMPEYTAKSAGGAYSAINGAPEKQAPANATPPSGSTSGGYNAITSRLGSLGTDPDVTIDQGLAALRAPGVPQSLREAYAEPLLRAKYFGNRSIA